MQSVLSWLASLPPATLYAALAAAAALENVFPPLPADTVVAFGAFLAARGHGSAPGAFLSIWGGNLGGALLMYTLGRRWGGAAMQEQLARFGGANAVERISTLYDRYGLAALFVSRFVPGLRSLVPPFAGALRMPAVPAMLAMGTASGLWYCVVTVVAYRVGRDWTELESRIAALSHTAAFIGAGALIVLVAGWLLIRRASRR